MFKICIWMNIPSHYQSAFFQALDDRADVDLRVVYLRGNSKARAVEGWQDTHDYQPFECCAAGVNPVTIIDTMLPDWPDRIHLICGYFASDLMGFFCRRKVAWCHWSEMPGIRLAELLGHRVLLFRLLRPFMLFGKRREGRRIREHALGAFGQGLLARRSFHLMGVPNNRIADLYYTPTALEASEPYAGIIRFAQNRKVFLSVGALCKRKGIDLLLKAFARLKTMDWCLVLCGHDRSNGAYQALCKRLGIEDRVLFLGAYSSERIAEVYAAADVFVLASRFDGWGAVLNEAASMGLPLIGTDLCGASWHVIQPDINGYRVRTGSWKSLNAVLGAYVKDTDLIKEHGLESARIFHETITPARNADRLVKALGTWVRR